ncbi:hypothetical protein K2X33_04010, partial [bacterium]|nr:hypothetical protein [bacterium]
MSKSAYIGVAAACFAVFYAAVWFIFRPRIEADLRQRTQAAVSQNVASLKSVEFSGRDGHLSVGVPGDVPVAENTARKIWGVRDAQAQAPAPTLQPARVSESLRIERNGETLRFTGHVSDDKTREAFRDALERGYPGMSVDTAAVDAEANQPADLLRKLEAFLPLLQSTAPQGALDYAEARLV